MTELEINKRINQFKPLIVKIARSFQKRVSKNVLFEDMVSAGMIGVWKALTKNNIDFNNSNFESFIASNVRWSIVDELRKQDWIGKHTRAKLNKKSNENITSSNNDPVVWLNDLPDSELERYFTLHSENSLNNLLDIKKQRNALMDAIDLLSERERLIIQKYYFEDFQFKDISLMLEVSQERINQLHKKIMKNLKSEFKTDTCNMFSKN